MHMSMPNATNGLNLGHLATPCPLAGCTNAEPSDQWPDQSNVPTNGPEQLLDLDGLLEIARLLHDIKRDGQLDRAGANDSSKIEPNCARDLKE
jgi:hypothetical protein